MSYLVSILKRLKFPKDCQEEVLNAYQKIKNKKDIEKILKQYKNENVDFPKLIASWQPILKKYKINQYLGDLLFCLLLCEKQEVLYKKNHLSNALFIETMTDLKYKAIECKLVKHTWGLFVTPWYGSFFKLRLFSLGRLQFEVYTFLADYDNKNVHLKAGQPCLNVHIARNGEPLDIKECKKSIARAKKFFPPYFKDYILFSCDSWFLFNKTLEFVGKDSNIYRFSKLFKLIKMIPVKDQSEEMWRLFDDDTSDLSKLKAKTSLQKKYLKYLKQGGKIGLGLGYFIYKF
ncbi:MAG: acyltransferase domain-containing protein [Bacilli bacterium]|nr:acyltransferase domain-containing protein [Bacilli bacterium]